MISPATVAKSPIGNPKYLPGLMIGGPIRQHPFPLPFPVQPDLICPPWTSIAEAATQSRIEHQIYGARRMRQVHRQEKAQLKKLFQQENIDRFEDRFKVYEVFLSTEQHLTVDELVARLQKNGHKLDGDFVSTTLKMMCHYGFARENRFGNGQVRYEHRHLGQHHDHMICTKCHDIVEFENSQLEQMQIRIADEFGFHMLQHKMEIYGICQKCRQKRDSLIPLVAAKQGERLVIKDIAGGIGARMRLMTMGLRPGDSIEVVTNVNRGQVVVAVDFNRYVLGRKLAQKILVQSKADQ